MKLFDTAVDELEGIDVEVKSDLRSILFLYSLLAGCEYFRRI